MLTISDIKTGLIIEYQEDPCKILSKQFTKVAQRRPVVACKLENLISGKVIPHTFQQSEKIKEAEIEKKPTQFLYQEKGTLFFMDPQTYEQFSLSKEQTGQIQNYLKEGTEVEILYFKEKPIKIELPIKIDLKVTKAQPGVKGDSAQAGTKEVECETGLKVQVPLFIKEGDMIKVDTRDGNYLERAN
jgi:elongation factor P